MDTSRMGSNQQPSRLVGDLCYQLSYSPDQEELVLKMCGPDGPVGPHGPRGPDGPCGPHGPNGSGSES